MLRKSVGCAKVPLCPFIQWEAPRVGICQLGCLRALPPGLVVQSSGSHGAEASIWTCPCSPL